MSALHYLDFDLQIDELEATSYRARVLNSPAGQAEGFFNLPYSDLELENFLLRIGRPRRGVRRINSPEMNEARKFGSKLFEAVFQGALQTCLLRSIDHAEQQNLGVRLRLRLPPSLFELPWEYLYDSSRQRFLSHSTSTPIVRYLDLPQSIKALSVTPPLKVLVMIASPSDYERLDVEAEWGKIKTAVADLEAPGLVQLTRLPGATLNTLQGHLRREHYHIFHFIGHGGFDQQTQDGVLLLESEDGRSRLVSGNHLGTLLHDHPSLRLAVLNACEGARTAKSDPFAGVAQQLVRQGIPAVIAMQFEITDTAALQLAREFYEALADGYPVDGALAEARKAIFTDENDIEWGTPVLYLRAADGRLFDIAARSSSDDAKPRRSSPDEKVTSNQENLQASVARIEQSVLIPSRRWIVTSIVTLLLVVSGLLLWQSMRPKGNTAEIPSTIQQVAATTAPTSTVEVIPATLQPRSTTPAIASIDPVSRTIWLDDAKNAVDGKDYGTGKGIYERLLAANPEDIDALLGLARTLRYVEGGNALALETLVKAVELAPNNPQVNFALGALYSEAFKENQRAIDHLTRAIENSSPALKRDVYFYRARAYATNGEYAKAIADMNEVITVNSNSDDYVGRAQIYQAWGNEKAAERDFTAAIDRAPEVGKYYLYRADFYAQINRVENAVTDYAAFLRLYDPNENQTLINKAVLYIEQHSATPTVTSTQSLSSTPAAGTQMTNPIDGAVYVYVPAGTFFMGLDEGGFDEKPRHAVYLDAFWIMQTEVTNEQYKKCVEADVCTLPFTSQWNTNEFWANYNNHPVSNVTWKQASTYAEWAGGRLPSEAEWEKAARGTEGRLYPWGNQRPTSLRLNFDHVIGDTQSVGRYPDSASPFGALDMAGNVWEWAADWYDPEYYQNSPNENPTGPEKGERRILRGGHIIVPQRKLAPTIEMALP